MEFKASASGTLGFGDVREIGYAVRDLGGGRMQPTDPIDPAVGVVWDRVAGDRVQAGERLALVHHRASFGLDSALERLQRSIVFDGHPSLEPLLLEIVLPTLH